MSRRRSTPTIHRWSRPLIGGIALLGAVLTAYLTISHQLGKGVACPTEGCDIVLNSPYATVFGLPLSLFGFVAYAGMAILAVTPLWVNNPEQKELRQKLESWSWLLLFAGAIAMTVFSGYLMYLLSAQIKVLCLYCIASACFSVLMLVLTIVGRDWPDVGNLVFTAIVVGIVTLVGTLGIYGISTGNTGSSGPGINVTTNSTAAEIGLAQHLNQIGAKMYGAYWCSHCLDQKQLFGKQAVKQIPYVECDPNGANPQPEACQAAKIQSYPTWEINGQFYKGAQPLPELAKISSYQGSKDFQNQL
ncbi:MAG: vitamin K epoxide reductase family protein [Aphanocapsa sp. GSE-SYN-MK-11-07L]|jgi:uncharacterized membrane protein|nr:vitamin K epoxide reductase family protein [Aphanocapsa sp. GSE-SYN-MK-11-07L]